MILADTLGFRLRRNNANIVKLAQVVMFDFFVRLLCNKTTALLV